MIRDHENEADGDHLMARLYRAGIELVIVVGPQREGDARSEWVGALLSVSGKAKHLPSVGQAIHAGLFGPGSPYRLAAFDPKKAPPERVADARARTAHVLEHLRGGRRSAGQFPMPLAGTRAHEYEERARSFARNTRLKFERVYTAARKAIEDEDTALALLKCRAARDLLREGNVLGAGQARVVEILEAHIERLSALHEASDVEA